MNSKKEPSLKLNPLFLGFQTGSQLNTPNSKK